MNKQNETENAFPQTKQVGQVTITVGGMTLRDYFAAKVIAECVSDYFRGAGLGDYPIDPEWPNGVALDAYRIADAMLAERERNND